MQENILSLDIGETRIGLALGSKFTKLAHPLITLSNDEEFTNKLQKLIDEYKVNLLVVGLPRNLNGDDTNQTQYCKDFAESLRSKININLEFQDEALTSVKANEELELTKKTYEKSDIDKLAACYILEDYLRGSN